MRRAAPGVAVVLSALVVMSVSGCGNSAGAVTTSEPETGAAAPAPSAPPVAKTAVSGLAGLVVVPKGYLTGDTTDPGEQSGPFSRESYLNTLSASPSEDRALLLNAHFAEGYQAYRTSADRKKHYTVKIFRVGSKAQADILRRGFWAQETHSRAFAVPGVPGALTDARIVVATSVGRTEAVAESSFVVGSLVTEISVSQSGDLTADLTPDTALVAAITKQQRQSLSRKSG
ncbi:hypothetical protein F1D05_26610 [Kribbella qitaiheensis]|uniref:Lipoprotein n=1 Tax=Kribbella qitaiheensis TaxID=1544730 RepID=A0A7G6X3L8_9ACTN|nr:hypothetical protein [Kribbella qitaiheensis]QNE20833.1 hypothetical protein F1D05_26610 [Kribbella qitaiheensis]